MTTEEARKVIESLVAYFPKIGEMLRFSKDGGAMTRSAWCRLLEPYSLAEAVSVVEQWQVEVLSRSMLEQPIQNMIRVIRDKRELDRKRSADEIERERYYQAKGHRRKDVSRAGEESSLMTYEMRAAMEEGSPLHRKLQDGELPPEVYNARLEQIFARHGIL